MQLIRSNTTIGKDFNLGHDKYKSRRSSKSFFRTEVTLTTALMVGDTYQVVQDCVK